MNNTTRVLAAVALAGSLVGMGSPATLAAVAPSALVTFDPTVAFTADGREVILTGTYTCDFPGTMEANVETFVKGSFNAKHSFPITCDASPHPYSEAVAWNGGFYEGDTVNAQTHWRFFSKDDVNAENNGLDITAKGTVTVTQGTAESSFQRPSEGDFEGGVLVGTGPGR